MFIEKNSRRSVSILHRRSRTCEINLSATILVLFLAAVVSCRSSVAKPSNQSSTLEHREEAPAVADARATPAVLWTTGCIDLNSAAIEELISLRGVGEVMAGRVIEYRERHGPFRRPEEIIIIEGFSERKYKAILDKICVK